MLLFLRQIIKITLVSDVYRENLCVGHDRPQQSILVFVLILPVYLIHLIFSSKITTIFTSWWRSGLLINAFVWMCMCVCFIYIYFKSIVRDDGVPCWAWWCDLDLIQLFWVYLASHTYNVGINESVQEWNKRCSIFIFMLSKILNVKYYVGQIEYQLTTSNF